MKNVLEWKKDKKWWWNKYNNIKLIRHILSNLIMQYKCYIIKNIILMREIIYLEYYLHNNIYIIK